MMKTVKIAIDGPSGAGKSTISRVIARRLRFIYIDTGAMYRAVALAAIRHGIDTKNESDKVISLLEDILIAIKHSDEGQQIYLNGENITSFIRTPEVSVGASDVAVIPQVRIKLVEFQRSLAEIENVIMDGRDIGTYVLPDADIKIFLTASIFDRAKRRYHELKGKCMECSFKEVMKDMEYRDNNDSSREFAPLRPAHDAILVDTSGNELEKSINIIQNIINERL